MLKNKSYFKKSTGDEAGCAPKKGIVTSKITGKVYFTSWSPNVKIEGKNVVRHLDLTTHNHGSATTNTGPWPYKDSMTPAQLKDCKDDMDKEKAACSDDKGNYKSADKCCKDPECQKARNCMLVPYGGSGSPNCCEEKTGHHILPNSLLQGTRGNSTTNVPGLKKVGPNAYTEEKGACICVSGVGLSSGDHRELHDRTKDKLREILESGETLTYEQAKTEVTKAHAETFPQQCNPKCIEAQIDASLSKLRTSGEIKVRQKDGMTRKNFDKYKNKKKKK
jgi:hypothetical protein